MTSAEWAAAARDEPHMSRRDLALMSTFDPHPDDTAEPAAHLMPAPGVDVLGVFAAEVEAARHLNVCQPCADNSRCDRCGDRMCAEMGPEPRICGTTCCDCPCSCTGCEDVRRDLRAELERQIEREAS